MSSWVPFIFAGFGLYTYMNCDSWYDNKKKKRHYKWVSHYGGWHLKKGGTQLSFSLILNHTKPPHHPSNQS